MSNDTTIKELEEDMISAALAEEARPVINLCETMIKVLPYSDQGILMGMQTFIGMQLATLPIENRKKIIEQFVELLRVSSVPR